MSLLNDWLNQSAAANGNACAVEHRDAYLSWRGLLHRVQRRALELSGMGIGPGDWVGMQLGNVPDLVILTLALEKLGAIAAFIDPTLPQWECSRIHHITPLRALITRPLGDPFPSPPSSERRGTNAPFALRIGETARTTAHPPTPFARPRLSGTLLTCNLYRCEPVVPEPCAGELTVAHYTLEAGGDPKAVLRGPEHLRAVAKTLVEGLNLEAGQSAMITAPLYRGFGFDLAIVAALSGQLTMLLEEKMSARTLESAAKIPNLAFVAATPSMFRDLSHAHVPTTYSGRALRLLCPHEPDSERVLRTFSRTWKTPVQTLLYDPECGPVTLERSGRKPEQVGQPLPDVGTQIRSVEGSVLPPGVRGQLWVRSAAASTVSVPRLPSPLRAIGSAGVPIGRSDKAGWLRTGAIGQLDAEAHLTMFGREDDLVDIDGQRVALGEVESCLETFSDVQEAEVHVTWNELAGPIVVARVVCGKRPSAETLLNHCARNLAPHKVPREIVFCENLD
ncbi:MAG: class I adenylate-forming enzyme family protein [Deltaproteobacteria bacterium]|nr:class I adenylate-forming enzyme family protein [Deltaproteobacteria bacterium]